MGASGGAAAGGLRRRQPPSQNEVSVLYRQAKISLQIQNIIDMAICLCVVVANPENQVIAFRCLLDRPGTLP